MMGSVFAMQGFGQLAGALVMLFLTMGFKESLVNVKTFAQCTGVCGLAVDKMWRTLVGKIESCGLHITLANRSITGFGAVPACAALYYRLTIPETPRYTFDVARDIEKGKTDAAAYLAGKSGGEASDITATQAKAESQALEIPKASWKDFFSFYGKWKNGKILLGTAGSWFLLDVAVSKFDEFLKDSKLTSIVLVLRSWPQLLNCAHSHRIRYRSQCLPNSLQLGGR